MPWEKLISEVKLFKYVLDRIYSGYKRCGVV